MEESLAPGLHPGVPEMVYRSWQFAVSQSTLQMVRKFHELRAYQEFTKPPEPEKYLDLGHALHLAALEPDKFQDQVVCGLSVRRQGAKNIALWKEFEEAHWGKIILNIPDFEKCLVMADALRKHALANELLNMPKARKELSVVWEDPIEKILCKGRYDLFGYWPRLNWSVIGDLKSTGTDLSSEALKRAIGVYGYDQQAAWYLDGAAALVPGVERHFLLIFVMSKPPHDVRIIEPFDSTIEEGRTKNRLAMKRWAKCVRSGKYPGFPQRVDRLGLMPWHEVKEWELDQELEEAERE